MNGARKHREELAKTWMLAQGVSVPHDHPGDGEFGLVIDMRRVAGFVDNVRFNDGTGDVVADIYLARRSLPGLMVLEECLVRTRQVIAALEKGEPVELSIGFWSTDEWLPSPMKYEGPNKEFEGREYTRIQRGIIYDHVAIVPLGACGERCRLGSAQAADHARALRERALKTKESRRIMPEGNQDCDKQKEVLERLAKLEQATKDAATAPAVTPDAIAKAVQEAVKPLTEKLAILEKREQDAQKARLDAKRLELVQLMHPMGDAKRHQEELAKLPTMEEAALDLMLTREKSFRGRADGTRVFIPPTQEGDAAQVKDGIAKTAYGFTAVELNKASKPGVTN
jgi:hypothetical protein